MSKKDKKNRTVLLVEDDPFLQKVLRQRLIDEGVNVVVEGDGAAAIEGVKEKKPDLVLLDLILPKKSGFEVLSELRKMPAYKHLPVVVLSNLGQQEDVEQMEKLGIREYLVKADFSLSEMVEKVLSHLDAVT